jgi:hypothetical protein
LGGQINQPHVENKGKKRQGAQINQGDRTREKKNLPYP